MLHGHPRFIFLSGCMIWLGAGRDFGGDSPGGQGDAPRAVYSPYPPRFSPPSPRFPDPLTPLGRTAYLCLYDRFQPCVSFRFRAVNGDISRGRYSLFTEIRIAGLLAAGFSIGRSNLTEAAISGVYREKRERFAHRPRRESPAGAARPEGNASGGSPPGGKRLSALPTVRGYNYTVKVNFWVLCPQQFCDTIKKDTIYIKGESECSSKNRPLPAVPPS